MPRASRPGQQLGSDQRSRSAAAVAPAQRSALAVCRFRGVFRMAYGPEPVRHLAAHGHLCSPSGQYAHCWGDRILALHPLSDDGPAAPLGGADHVRRSGHLLSAAAIRQVRRVVEQVRHPARSLGLLALDDLYLCPVHPEHVATSGDRRRLDARLSSPLHTCKPASCWRRMPAC